MGWWEEQVSSNIADYEDKVTLWCPYIDDIFIIWKGDVQSALNFVAALNDNEYNLKLSEQHSNTSIPFLDVEVNVENGLVHTMLYRKVTAECRVSGMFVVERMEWGGCGELEEGAVGVDQGGEQADTGVGVLSYLNKLQGNSMLFDELYYKNFGDDYITSLKPSLILLVFEATRNE
ncbi:hypothetical protein NDU88_005610 [Pleurodeles waltl]|uniref:Uncharacterized protein n=1 Tax=Pleurodeles waltl TaxID=8319 RepID=A0AAV7N1R8_PLEWA|nr:hypothetical protein NDU88_005610 [Pleurodeles waltl]